MISSREEANKLNRQTRDEEWYCSTIIKVEIMFVFSLYNFFPVFLPFITLQIPTIKYSHTKSSEGEGELDEQKRLKSDWRVMTKWGEKFT